MSTVISGYDELSTCPTTCFRTIGYVPTLARAVSVISQLTCGVFAGMQLGDRESVLALARPVAVGQILTAQDLKQVSMATDSGMDVMPASSASTVVGQPVAFSLRAGSLVTRSVLRARSWQSTTWSVSQSRTCTCT